MLSGGFATLNRPAKFGFFLSEKLGDAGRAPAQAPLRLRGDGLVWGGRPYGYAVGAWCGAVAPTATRWCRRLWKQTQSRCGRYKKERSVNDSV